MGIGSLTILGYIIDCNGDFRPNSMVTNFRTGNCWKDLFWSVNSRLKIMPIRLKKYDDIQMLKYRPKSIQCKTSYT